MTLRFLECDGTLQLGELQEFIQHQEIVFGFLLALCPNNSGKNDLCFAGLRGRVPTPGERTILRAATAPKPNGSKLTCLACAMVDGEPIQVAAYRNI